MHQIKNKALILFGEIKEEEKLASEKETVLIKGTNNTVKKIEITKLDRRKNIASVSNGTKFVVSPNEYNNTVITQTTKKTKEGSKSNFFIVLPPRLLDRLSQVSFCITDWEVVS